MKIEFSDNEKVTVTLKKPTPEYYEGSVLDIVEDLLIEIREMLILGRQFAYMSAGCCEDAASIVSNRSRFASLSALLYAAREKCDVATGEIETLYVTQKQSANNTDSANSSTTGGSK